MILYSQQEPFIRMQPKPAQPRLVRESQTADRKQIVSGTKSSSLPTASVYRWLIHYFLLLIQTNSSSSYPFQSLLAVMLSFRSCIFPPHMHFIRKNNVLTIRLGNKGSHETLQPLMKVAALSSSTCCSKTISYIDII